MERYIFKAMSLGLIIAPSQHKIYKRVSVSYSFICFDFLMRSYIKVTKTTKNAIKLKHSKLHIMFCCLSRLESLLVQTFVCAHLNADKTYRLTDINQFVCL